MLSTSVVGLGHTTARRLNRRITIRLPRSAHPQSCSTSTRSTATTSATQGRQVVLDSAARGSQSSSSSSSSSEGSATASFFLGPLLLTWYARKLESHPVVTKSITSGLIAGAGDLLCQAFVDKAEKEKELALQGSDDAILTTTGVDQQQQQITKPLLWWWTWQRTANFAILGTVMVGPTLHYWYGGLAARFPLEVASPGKAVLKRVLWDQGFFTLPFCACWMTALWTLEGVWERTTSTTTTSTTETIATLPERLLKTLPEVMVANWILWVPVQCINFWITPVPFQVLVSNCVALGWNAYLSFSTRTTVKGDEKPTIQQQQQQQQVQRRRTVR